MRSSSEHQQLTDNYDHIKTITAVATGRDPILEEGTFHAPTEITNMTRRSRQRQSQAATSFWNDEEPIDYNDQTTNASTITKDQPQHSINVDQDESQDVALLSSPDAPASLLAAQATLQNFTLMSILFSCNHGCVVACLGLATSRLGFSLGAAQSGILYLCYTLSGLFGSTYVVKRLGSRNALMAGMAMYILYVGCFWFATVMQDEIQKDFAVYLGGVVGGTGAGFLWTAQGSYFTSAAQEYAKCSNQSTSDATSKLAGIFAFLYLALEVLLRAMSTMLLQAGLEWSSVFQIYALLTAASTILMLAVQQQESTDTESSLNATVFNKATAAWQLLKNDPRMKYMVGLNAVFGLSASFLNSYVNGQVVRIVLQDESAKYVGILTAGMASWAAMMSLVFGKASQALGKGPILVAGSISFAFVALPFLVYPKVENWSWVLLVFVYMMQGTGRATFEGTLKATFADFFSFEKEGAFANIILQTGLSTSIGYVMTFSLTCAQESNYCVPYQDGSLHNVLSFELAIVVAAVAAIAGYWKASLIHERRLAAASSAFQLTESSLLAAEPTQRADA
ncbi:hypothetical protein MPSEU_001099800 [Mayamaea pseudoterrestris]|nr:hypothetical protein MPSEU_001099800 [Mayamaea pseudoterrestris]